MTQLATGMCVLLIAYLFVTDLRRPDGRSLALWVPTIWMFLAGSRYVSAWLNLSPTFESAVDFADGSPLDRAVFLCLMIAGGLILLRRRIQWEQLLTQNLWIVLYLLYCLASIAWTNDATILMKRWVKDLGNPIMVLVILTERRPYEALGVVIRRLAFLLLPLSVLFIKYYPELGRWYRHDGAQTFIGVGTQKNQLGLACLIIGIYMCWEFLHGRQRGHATFIHQNKMLGFLLATMLAWLLYMSNSKTALVCLVAAILILLLGRLSFMARSPVRLYSTVFGTVLAVWLLDQVLPLKELMLSLLGRRPDLTDRTDIWATLLTFDVNPLVGAGFMSFWTGARLEEAWHLLGVRIKQAHNGYLEQYLNLGYIGVAFILIIMLSGLNKAQKHLKVDPSAGILRFCFICVAALYNYTEAAFYGLNNMWILLLVGCLQVPQPRHSKVGVRRPPAPVSSWPMKRLRPQGGPAVALAGSTRSASARLNKKAPAN